MAEDLYMDFEKDFMFHMSQEIDMEMDTDIHFEDQDSERENNTEMDMRHTSSKHLLQYNLFVYRKELRRRKMNRCNLTKSKIHLTGGLLLNCEGRICDFSLQDIEAFTEGVVLKDRLVKQLQSLYGDIDEEVEKDVEGKIIAKCNLT